MPLGSMSLTVLGVVMVAGCCLANPGLSKRGHSFTWQTRDIADGEEPRVRESEGANSYHGDRRVRDEDESLDSEWSTRDAETAKNDWDTRDAENDWDTRNAENDWDTRDADNEWDTRDAENDWDTRNAENDWDTRDAGNEVDRLLLSREAAREAFNEDLMRRAFELELEDYRREAEVNGSPQKSTFDGLEEENRAKRLRDDLEKEIYDRSQFNDRYERLVDLDNLEDAILQRKREEGPGRGRKRKGKGKPRDNKRRMW